LDELVHIIHCFIEKGRLVLPVFYGVKPSQVRDQTGSYGKALAKHKINFQNNLEKYSDNMERLLKWKMALNQAANLSGYHYNLGYLTSLFTFELQDHVILKLKQKFFFFLTLEQGLVVCMSKKQLEFELKLMLLLSIHGCVFILMYFLELF
jgi:hypothetical protein